MKIFAPLGDELYIKVIFLKDISIVHIDMGNIEVKEGEIYYSYIGEYLDEWSETGFLIKVGSFLWPFDKKQFLTLRELREKKLKDLGL